MARSRQFWQVWQILEGHAIEPPVVTSPQVVDAPGA